MALISLNNLERFFNNLKTYISNALSSKANTSHTHTSSDVTDLSTILDGKLDVTDVFATWNYSNGNLEIPNVFSNTIDSSLSSSSENPVQNKVVKNALDGKIPLAGTNALSGSIVPDANNSYDFGSSTYKLRYVYADTAYITNLNINGKAIGTDASSNLTYDGHIVDTIEEQGNGYIRYSNGLQICWGTITWQSACSTAWGSLYETDACYESYAKSFVGTPSVSASGSIGDSSAMVDFAVASNTVTPAFYLCRGTSRTEVKDCVVRYIAIGRWK